MKRSLVPTLPMDEESSPEINSESGASDGSDVVSSDAEEEMEDIAE